MASISVHQEHIQEHIQELEDAIAIGLEKRPATIGLHTSACSIELLELYLHVLNKITSGGMLKHEWFKSPQPDQKIAHLAERKISAQFPAKEELFLLMYGIEEERNKLIYGKPRLSSIESAWQSFQKLYTIIKEKLKEQGVDIA